jgi:hypothetical protein
MSKYEPGVMHDRLFATQNPVYTHNGPDWGLWEVLLSLCISNDASSEKGRMEKDSDMDTSEEKVITMYSNPSCSVLRHTSMKSEKSTNYHPWYSAG